MDFGTNHDRNDAVTEYAFSIFEEYGDGINTAELGVKVDGYIDSRNELSLTIRKNALAFLKRAVAQLEKELEG